MPALLGFVAPPAPPPALAPPKPANSPRITKGPVTQAKPITGGSYPSLRPVSPPPPPPPPPAAAVAAGGAAGGLGLGAVAAAVVGAIALVLFFDSPVAAPTLMHPPEPPQFLEPPNIPFKGGQVPQALYRVTFEWGCDSIFASLPPRRTIEVRNFYGQLVGLRLEQVGNNANFHFTSHGSAFRGYRTAPIEELIGNEGSGKNFYYRVLKVERLDQPVDDGGDLPPLTPLLISAPGNSLGAPRAAPPSSAPAPAPTAPSPFGSPSRSPGSFPGSSPSGSPSPSPIPNPGPTPQPQKYPGPAPNPNPYPSPNGDPAPSPGPGVGAPSPSPTPAPAPGPGSYRSPPAPDPTDYPDTGFQPNIFTPNPLTPGPGLTPNPLTPNPLAPSPFTPNPDTGNPEPKAPPLISPPRTPTPQPTPNDDLFKQFQDLIGPVTIALTGITGLVQPERLRDAATVGSCRSFAPGGCNASIGNNAQNAASSSAANNALLAQILAFLQALQALFMVPILAGVNLINTKLGPVMAGVNGIGGFLARTAEAAKLDKVLNAMNTVLLLHNAAMLSRNLGSTLGDLTSQVLTTIGIKDSEGAGIDVNEILGKQANSFMASLLGAEVWAGTKTSWNKASSIISSATNLMYTMRSIFDSTREILEWTAENTGKIGNALKRFRIVGENAYKWLPERVTVQNSFTRKLDRFREGVDDLDDAASSLSGVLGEVQSIQQEYADLQEQKQKFEKNISELTPKPRDENKPVSDAVTAAKTVSAAPPGIENVFRGEGEKIDD